MEREEALRWRRSRPSKCTAQPAVARRRAGAARTRGRSAARRCRPDSDRRSTRQRAAATARKRAGPSRNMSAEPSTAPGPNWNVLPHRGGPASAGAALRGPAARAAQRALPAQRALYGGPLFLSRRSLACRGAAGRLRTHHSRLSVSSVSGKSTARCASGRFRKLAATSTRPSSTKCTVVAGSPACGPGCTTDVMCTMFVFRGCARCAPRIVTLEDMRTVGGSC